MKNTRSRGQLSASALAAIVLCLLFTSMANGQMSAWRKRLAAAGLTVGINPHNPNTVLAEGSYGKLNISFDKGRTWPIERDAGGLFQIRQIIVHPSDTNTIFMASGDPFYGLVKSTDFGLSWRSVVSIGIDGESVALDPVHPDTMYAANFGNGRVYRSYDRGESWTLLGDAGSQLCAFTVRPDSVNILFGGTGGGTISKSTDFGVTWRVVKPGTSSGFLEVPKISISPTNPRTAYATLNGNSNLTLGVWKTTDGGETWIQTAAPNISFWAMDIDPVDPNILYAGTFVDQLATVYKTTDGGLTWNPTTTGFPAGGYIWSLRVHPTDSSIVWSSVTIGAFGYDGIYRLGSSSTILQGFVRDRNTLDTVRNGSIKIATSLDSINLATSGGLYAFAYFDGDESLTPTIHVEAFPYYLTDMPLAFQIDSLVTTDIFVDELPKSAIVGSIRDSVTHDAIIADVSLAMSTLYSTTILRETTTTTGQFQFGSLYVSQPPVVVYRNLTVDPAIPFANMVMQHVGLDTNGLVLMVDLVTADVLVVASTDSGKYSSYYRTALDSLRVTYNMWDVARRGTASLSRGIELTKRVIVYYTGLFHSQLPESEKAALRACLDAGCHLFLTGQDIAEKNDSSTLLRDYLQVGFASNTSIIFTSGIAADVFNGFGFFTTTAGANNQTSRDILLPLSSRVKPVLAYGAGSSGTAAVRIDSTGGGGKAIVMGFGFEAIADVQARKAVMQRILGYFDGSIVVSIDDRADGSVPGEFQLYQNYPNPFNPTTMLRFDVPAQSMVTLRVFNLLGQQVDVIASGHYSVGSYAADWNASHHPSGAYFVQFLAVPVEMPLKPFVLTRPMMLTK